MSKERAVQVTTQRTLSKDRIESMVITAVFIALTYIFTAFVNVCIPPGSKGGLVHLGNIPLFIAAIVFGKKTGALAGSIGMGLFDLLSGWAIWAPFTFLINGCIGYTVGVITEKRRGFKWTSIALVVATIIKVVGYYIAEVILYKNWIVPVTNIPANITQVWVAGVIVLACVEQLRKIADGIFRRNSR